MKVPKTILVPTDFSSCARIALDYAVGLAHRLDATIHLVHVVGSQILAAEFGFAVTPPMLASLTEAAQAELDRQLAAHAGQASFAPALLEVGDARTQIHHAAERIGAELIVMGTHGRRGIKRFLVGSVAESVVRAAPCPVLLVRDEPQR